MIRARTAVLVCVLIASVALGQEKPAERSDIGSRFVWTARPFTQYKTPSTIIQDDSDVAPGRRLTPTPLYEPVSAARVMFYRTQSDFPRYSDGFDGSGIAVPDGGNAPRSAWGIGLQSGYMEGGGCFPVDPNTPNQCLQETNSFGNLVTVFKEREIWTFRLSYIDPTIQTPRKSTSRAMMT